MGHIPSSVDSHKLLSSPIEFTVIILKDLISPTQLMIIIAPLSIILKLSGENLTLASK